MNVNRSRSIVVLVLTCLATCFASAGLAGPAQAAFGLEALDGSVFDATGNAYTQAGGHPFGASVSFSLNTTTDPELGLMPDGGGLKNVSVKLPPGLIGNPQAMPTCPKTQRIPALDEAVSNTDLSGYCPVTSIVGIALLKLALQGTSETWASPVFSLEPPPGVPAQFGFSFLNNLVFLDASLRSDGDYGIDIVARNLPQGAAVIASTVTLWGVPAAGVHDSQRCLAFIQSLEASGSPVPQCDDLGGLRPLLGPHAANMLPRALLTNPTRCTPDGVGLETTVRVESWRTTSAPDEASFISHQAPGYPLPPDQWGPPVGLTGCDQLPFAPTFDAQPDEHAADAPTGLQVDLAFPQDSITNPDGLATANLKRALVTLPEGMTVSPSSADGLQGCSDAQLAVGTRADVSCPEASKIGTVTATTPLLEESLEGSVYVGTQASDDPESGDLFRIFIVLESKERGILVKLPGKVVANAKTGRLTATFDNNPQLPVSQLSLRFTSGPRAPLATPPACGTKTVDATLTSWGGQTAELADSFNVDCPGADGFSPSFGAGTLNPTGGAFSPFSVRIARPDRQRTLGGVTLELPTGLIAKLKDVPLCGDAQAAAGTCPVETRVGTATVGAGPGSSPFFIDDGSVSLTGPYKGAPYGLSVAVRALAGPFDLGTVVVRQAIYVDPTDAHLTVVSDPLPTIVKGVPLRLRSIVVDVDRPGFTLNPTSCSPKQVRAVLSSADGATTTLVQRFQAGECRSLAFKPRLALALTGKRQLTDGKHPGLRAVLRQGRGQAGLKRVEVRLPLSLALDPNNSISDDLCEFAEGQKADPHCPKSSVIGRAKAWTPVLNRPLTGPVYFVKNVRRGSSGRLIRTLPTLLVPLRGEVALNLRAQTAVKRGKLVNTFPVVPDAPVSRFELTLKGGRHGILVTNGNLCRKAQRATTLIDAHNGRRADRVVRLKAPCAKRRR